MEPQVRGHGLKIKKWILDTFLKSEVIWGHDLGGHLRSWHQNLKNESWTLHFLKVYLEVIWGHDLGGHLRSWPQNIQNNIVWSLCLPYSLHKWSSNKSSQSIVTSDDLEVILRTPYFITFNIKQLWFNKVCSQMPLTPSFRKSSQQQQEEERAE